MPLKFCPRCRAAHDGRCPVAKKQSARQCDERRGSFRERGYTTAWDKFRKLVLQREPFCRSCMTTNRLKPAYLVDHIIPLRAGGALLSFDNTQPLCSQCHSVKTDCDRKKYPEVYEVR
jgi:5-methylcytosine-specific restriction protein A